MEQPRGCTHACSLRRTSPPGIPHSRIPSRRSRPVCRPTSRFGRSCSFQRWCNLKDLQEEGVGVSTCCMTGCMGETGHLSRALSQGRAPGPRQAPKPSGKCWLLEHARVTGIQTEEGAENRRPSEWLKFQSNVK